MAIFGLFDIGKSAIFASRAALDVTANNIANINTPGFSRKEAILDIQTPGRTRAGFIGRGVTVGQIRRHYDNLLQNQILLQQQNFARSNSLGNAFRQVEEVFNEQQYPKFSASFNEYINAWQEVSNNPESQPQRSVLLQRARGLISMAKDMERSLRETVKQTDSEIEDSIGKVNSITSKIASMNGMITEVEAGSSHEASDLRDKRDNLMGQLSELIGFKSFEDDSGRVTIVMGSKNLVEGERSFALASAVNPDNTIDITAGNDRVNDYISRGALSGLLASREEIQEGPLKNFRSLVASIVKETNLQHRQGYDLGGSTDNDFFAPLQLFTRDYSDGAAVTSKTISDLSQLTLHEYEIRFSDSSTYSVVDLATDTTVIPPTTYISGDTIAFDGIEIVVTDDAGGPRGGDKFLVTPLELSIENFALNISSAKGVAASTYDYTLPGDNRNALAMIDLYQGDVSDIGNSFNGYYRTIVTLAGTMSSTAQDSTDFEQSLLNELNMRRESVSGVNLDEEAANLIRYQKAFEAGAKLIKVTDELLEVILNL
ncbi:Flagellar hook-associated protein FlgK [hydrothermal vent metagenome]|uniref:Flagellar hook-associated protein FlgK n=1 Tax=hydrothermal vent metagenome TaxID=652676 RepID=A0A3B1D5L4_9ZZZZ